MSPRRAPAIGDHVTVIFLAARVPGVVERVDDAGRSITVVLHDGDRLAFALNRATGQFVEGGLLAGARLLLDTADPV